MFLNKTEIIICGETKKLNLKYIKNLKKYINTKFINVKENSISKKKEFGY